MHRFRKLHGAGDCRSQNYLKGITYSLFGALNALTEIKQNGQYDIEFGLFLGTLIASQRNTQIFPWDSDADIFLIFNDDHMNYNENALETFGQHLKTEIDKLLGHNNTATLSWNTDGPDNSRHTMHVEALNQKDSKGFLDIFVLTKQSGNTLRNKHYHVSERGVFNGWSDSSIEMMLPTQEVIWDVYGEEMVVNIPNQYDKYLTAEYGPNWMTPNVPEPILKCPVVDAEHIEKWMVDINKYKHLNESKSYIDDVTAMPQNIPTLYFVVVLIFGWIFCFIFGYCWGRTQKKSKMNLSSDPDETGTTNENFVLL